MAGQAEVLKNRKTTKGYMRGDYKLTRGATAYYCMFYNRRHSQWVLDTVIGDTYGPKAIDDDQALKEFDNLLDQREAIR